MIAVVLHDKPLLFLSSENHNSNVKFTIKSRFLYLYCVIINTLSYLCNGKGT